MDTNILMLCVYFFWARLWNSCSPIKIEWIFMLQQNAIICNAQPWEFVLLFFLFDDNMYNSQKALFFILISLELCSQQVSSSVMVANFAGIFAPVNFEFFYLYIICTRKIRFIWETVCFPFHLLGRLLLFKFHETNLNNNLDAYTAM